MSPEVQIAWITALPGFAAALVAAVASIRNGRKTDRVRFMVDGNLTAIRTELLAANNRIGQLEGILKTLSASDRRRGIHEPEV